MDAKDRYSLAYRYVRMLDTAQKKLAYCEYNTCEFPEAVGGLCQCEFDNWLVEETRLQCGIYDPDWEMLPPARRSWCDKKDYLDAWGYEKDPPPNFFGNVARMKEKGWIVYQRELNKRRVKTFALVRYNPFFRRERAA